MKKFLTFLIAMTLFPAFGQETLQLSLKECIQYAENHNITLVSGGLDINTAEIQLKQAKLKMTPTVSAGLGQNFGYSHGNEAFSIGGNYSINAGIDIFRGLAIRNGIKQSELQLNQAQLQVEQSKNQIRINIIRSYLTILMNQEKLSYQDSVLQTTREQVLQGEYKYKVGKILESDYMLLQAQYISDSINIENTKIAIDNEYVTLRNLLNLNNNQSLTITVPTEEQLASSMNVPELNTVLQQALGYLPEKRIKETAIDIAEYDVKIAKGSYYPSITASAGVSTGYNAAYGSDMNGLQSGLYKGLGENIGVNVSIPIYNQGNVRNNVKLKEIAVQRAELALQNVENEISQEIEAYYLDVKKAYNDYTLSERQQAAYYANYMAYYQKLKVGSITVVDFLQQENNYLNILNNYMQNKYSFLLQKKVLDVYTGQPVEL